MTLNPHQFVGQQLWYVRGTSKRGPITVGEVKDDPHGYFITDPNTKIRHSVGPDELHASDESATEQVNSEKAARKEARDRKRAQPNVAAPSELGRFLGINPTRGK